jgi:hypothetical protein
MKNIFILIILITGLGLFFSCNKGSTTEPVNGTKETRSFALGFTDFPHANSLDALVAAFGVIKQDGDMAVMHFDGGVPWQEALDGTPYPQNFLDELNGKAGAIPPGHLTYLAVTPIAFSRNTLAENIGQSGSEPLSPPWDTLTFDSPQVIQAFINHCEKLITIYTPEFFAYAIEANMLIDLAPSEWNAFVSFAQSVYTSLKTNHPTLPVFITLQAEWFHDNPNTQSTNISQILPFTDYIAVSSYPFIKQSDPNLLAADYFTKIANLAPNKPFAIAETSWAAEDVTAPYPILIPATEETQKAYLERLLSDSDSLSAAFVCWFFTRDFDEFWESDLQFSPIAATVRLWKDSGLYDGQGNPRPALTLWREYLTLQRVPK